MGTKAMGEAFRHSSIEQLRVALENAEVKHAEAMAAGLLNSELIWKHRIIRFKAELEKKEARARDEIIDRLVARLNASGKSWSI